jgi:hypothetical protein
MNAPAAIPPRFWWLKRLTTGGLVLLLLLLGLRLWWGWIAQRRIDVEITAAKARKEPLKADDLAATQHPLLDNQNAVVALKAAVASVSYNPAQSAFESRFDPVLPVSTMDQKMLHGIVTTNAKAIALARSMIALPRADWGVQLTTPISNVTAPRFIGQAQLARLLRNAAIDEHIHADDAQAVKDLRVIFRQGDALDDGGPFLIANLVAGAVDEIASNTIRQIAGELRIENRGASAQDVRDLIRSILADQKHTSMAAQGWYEQRVNAIEFPAQLSQLMSPLQSWEYWIVKPMIQLDEVRQFQNLTAIAHAFKEPTFPAASAELPATPIRTNFPPLYTYSHIYLAYLMPRYTNLVASYYRVSTQRRAAAVLLALRLYELNHGSPPPNLDTLVPDYLPSVPIDPLSSDNHVLRYIATTGKQAVYSVGFDGKDDDGSTQFLAPATGQSLDPWNMRDAVFPLHPPPTTAPVH